MAIATETRQLTAADLRAALRLHGFTARKERDHDLRESQFSIRHPQDERVELVAVIDVKNVFDKDGAYGGVNVFTLVKDAPLNVPNHPLNIVIGLPQLHNLGLFNHILLGASAAFRATAVDEVVTGWYAF